MPKKKERKVGKKKKKKHSDLTNALQQVQNGTHISNIVNREGELYVPKVPRTFVKITIACCTYASLIWRALKYAKGKTCKPLNARKSRSKTTSRHIENKPS